LVCTLVTKTFKLIKGSAIAVAAIATAFLVKPQCWNELIIDQILDDGDTYYIDSYKLINISDRRNLTLLDFKQHIDIQKTNRIFLQIDDPIYAGSFRSESPKELHVAKALHLFFKKYDAVILTSKVLNIAIWKNSKYYHIFDAQPRLDNCDIADLESNGTAKLILLQNLSGVLFIILQKSNVKNEAFTLYRTTVVNVKKISDLSENYEKFPTLPQRRPSGYRIQDTFRAIARGSYHLHHSIFPEEFHGRGHLIVAIEALIYSKLLSASKWTKAIIDLLLNYANIYLADIVRVLGKTLDDTFQLSVSDLLTDVIFGVYTAKIKVDENVIPGQDSKVKLTIDDGIRKFFATHSLGIIEIHNNFYAIWKENNKFYYLDPFACDSDGFRVSSRDPDDIDRYKTAASCITMNSSINQLIEVMIENTEFKDKDTFIIHGFNVLYVKTGNAKDGSDEKIIFREKKVNRRPLRLPTPPSEKINECANLANMSITPRFEIEIPVNENIQCPELMNQVEHFVHTFDEFSTTDKDPLICPGISYYKIIKPHRLLLEGQNNCLDENFAFSCRGRQGLIIAIAALIQTKQIHLTNWTGAQIDKVINSGNMAYAKIANSILAQLEKEKAAAHGKPVEDNNEKCQKPKILDHLNLSMLPDKMKINDAQINLIFKMNIVEGEANPLVNLGEAFERYFEQFHELILENKKLMYSVWKNNDKYCILNPYGADKEGWRNTNVPATLFIVDSIGELIDICYGLLEFNDYHFAFHFIQIKLLSSDDSENKNDRESITANLSKFEVYEKYETKFLPITDEVLAKIIKDKTNIDSLVTKKENENQDENKNIEKDQKEKIDKKGKAKRSKKEEEDTITNLFEHIKESEQLDTPLRLNFSLITGAVKIEQTNEYENHEENLDILYEKLKYNHPPPFVMPPKKNFCNLLDIKLASKSIHSLVSRFSFDSKLSIKENNPSHSAKDESVISLFQKTEKSKVITLPSKQYFILKSLPSGLTPIRAINEQFIHNKCIEKDKKEREKEEEEKCKSKEKEIEMIPEPKILPLIIPRGPCISTPNPKQLPDCPEIDNNQCILNMKEQEDAILKKLICSTENLMLEVIIPDFKENVVC
jgi:hypothetical protein